MSQPHTNAHGSVFVTTHWTAVLRAAEPSSAEREALEELCAVYFRPIYAFVRRRGYDVPDAEDLVQEFFAKLLSKQYLRAVDPRKGRFRSFLLAALDHFLANESRKKRALKRGGAVSFISFDVATAEEQILGEAALQLSPERTYERRWAIALLEAALGRLQQEYTDADHEQLFDSLKVFLTGENRGPAYREIAGTHGMTEAAVKMAVSRLRKRYGAIVREEVARTVSTESEIEEELQALFAALAY